MNLTKIAKLFSKKNKNTEVSKLLDDMPKHIAEQLDAPKGNSWITKAEAREAKKNFQKERGDSQDPNDLVLLAELDDIILGNVKGIEPTQEILGKGWKEYAQGGNKFEGDLKAYPLRFAGDELDREMFQRKYINSYDSWATKKEDQVSAWYNNTEEGKRFQLENFGQIMSPFKDTSMINKTTKKGPLTELEIMRKLKTENTSDITLDDIDRYDFSQGGEANELEIIESLIANGKIEATIKKEIKKEKDDSKKHKLQTLLERIHSGEIDATNIRENMGARKKKATGGKLVNDREAYNVGGIISHMMGKLGLSRGSGGGGDTPMSTGLHMEELSPQYPNRLENYRPMFAEGGETLTTPEESPMGSQMGKLMGSHTMPDGTEMAGETHGESEEQTMLPDEDMEEDYVDFVVNQALSDDEKEFLNTELESNNALSMIFDKVIEVAAEFSGEGPVDGPGTEISDSIPARLSDGEFVFTAEAVKVIGVEKLEELMNAAEAQNDERIPAYSGGMIQEEKEVMAASKEPQQQNINVTKTTLDNETVMYRDQEDLVGKTVKENMMLDPYQKHVRS